MKSKKEQEGEGLKARVGNWNESSSVAHVRLSHLIQE